MCIAILAPKDKVVPTEILVRCFQGNRDGAGFAYLNKGEVVIDKGFMDMASFLSKYKELTQQRKVQTRGPMLIHCRIATIGKVCPDNCHPFRIRDGALVHNGSLWWDYYSGRDSKKSDTRIFAERLHNALKYEDIIFDKVPIEKELGYDKMALLYKTGDYIILNEDRGTWHEGIWYSHGSFLRSPTVSAWGRMEDLD